MPIVRLPHLGVPLSAARTLYAQHDGNLLAPLDICVINSNEEFINGLQTGKLIGATVQTTSAVVVGTIAGYDFPPGIGRLVSPIVIIEPDAGLDFSNVPQVNPVDAPQPEDTRVHITRTIFGTTHRIDGTITRDIERDPYPDTGFLTLAYLVHFDAAGLTREQWRTLVGTRVALDDGRALGMLISVANAADQQGRWAALVHPAHRV